MFLRCLAWTDIEEFFFFFPANHNYKLWTKEKGKGKLLKVAKDAKLVRNLGTRHPSQDIVSSAP